MMLIRRPAAAPGASGAKSAGTTPAKPDPAQRRTLEGSPRVATNPYEASSTSTYAEPRPDPLPARKTARK